MWGESIYCPNSLCWVFVKCLEAIAEALPRATSYTTIGRLCSTPQVQAKVTWINEEGDLHNCVMLVTHPRRGKNVT